MTELVAVAALDDQTVNLDVTKLATNFTRLANRLLGTVASHVTLLTAPVARALRMCLSLTKTTKGNAVTIFGLEDDDASEELDVFLAVVNVLGKVGVCRRVSYVTSTAARRAGSRVSTWQG